jgi:glutamyl-tRNA synthetase
MFGAVQERIVVTSSSSKAPAPYRGRIAPTPSGWLHLGHAATFRTAWERARQAGGRLVYRTEDLDPDRCRPEYARGAMEDLRWYGLDWDEGPDCGGSFGPYVQSQRMEIYRACLVQLAAEGHVYPCSLSRKEIDAYGPARSSATGEALFPPALRGEALPPGDSPSANPVNWRFRVPDGERVTFEDGRCGKLSYTAGADFGDFLVWRRDGFPAYELAVVVDDHAMGITEVVRGEDLLVSTARQILLYKAMGWAAPDWFHCPLVLDSETGLRLSKSGKSMSLREMRSRDVCPDGLPARPDPDQPVISKTSPG